MNRSSILIILFALIFFIINEVVSYNIALKEEIAVSYKKDKQILINLFDAQEEYLSVITKLLVSDSVVIDAYLKNDPLLIQKHVQPMWESLRNDKLIHEIHFFQPPAISFVNFSNFQSIGKDVSKIRTDILWATSSFKEDSHFLMCRTYAGYRTTEPIMYKGKILGGLSLGKKVDWIPHSIKEDTHHDAFLVYAKDAPSSLLKKYYIDFMKNKQVFNNFILADRTIKIPIHSLMQIDFTKDIQDISIEGERYKLFSYPIIDFNKNTMAYVCILSDLKNFNARFINFTIKELVLVFITILLLLFLNGRRHKKVLSYIQFIKGITDKVKARDFSFLRTKKSPLMNDVGIDSLNELEENIIQMGLSIEKQYIYLENDNKLKAEELIAQLYRDELTGLGNRSALLHDLKKFNSSIVALFNIRLFKSINDAFGLEAGNHVLKELASIYTKISSNNLKVYRTNADEFALLSPVHLATNDFIQAVKNVIKTIEKTTFRFQNINMSINIYAGICLDEEKKLEKATLALGYAKESNSSYTVYNEKHNAQEIQTNNIQMINKIADALQNDNIIAYFQAIVDKKGHPHKYEALVRMRDNGEILSPYFFLEISKKTSMYSDITKTMIEQTFQKFENTDIMFSINLTADDILNTEILQLIDSKLENFRNPQQVVFELVESDDLYSLPEIEEFLKNIKEKGAKIAIDDFGTGYSNFSYILKIKPDYLKIDGSLIKNLDTDAAAYKIVNTIINFGHDLDIKIIAEFVHSEEIFNICLKLGVDEFQGYYFSEPQEALLK